MRCERERKHKRANINENKQDNENGEYNEGKMKDVPSDFPRARETVGSWKVGRRPAPLRAGIRHVSVVGKAVSVAHHSLH